MTYQQEKAMEEELQRKTEALERIVAAIPDHIGDYAPLVAILLAVKGIAQAALAPPQPEIEEVEVVRWLVKEPEGNYVGIFFASQQLAQDYLASMTNPTAHDIIRMVGKDLIPKKQKVKHRVKVTLPIMISTYPTVPSDAEFYAEWETEA